MTPLERARGHIAAGLMALDKGDPETAEREAREAREIANAHDLHTEIADASGLLGTIAHARGRWHATFREEFETTIRDAPELAGPIIDAHLCRAESSLHGSDTPGDVALFAAELLGIARGLGSDHASALALLLLGTAEVHAGASEAGTEHLRTARRLAATVASTSLGAIAAQRLAQAIALRQAREAERLLNEAHGLARRSQLVSHLLARVHGAAVELAPEPAAARRAVAKADGELAGSEVCDPCSIAYLVASAIACAHTGEIDEATVRLEEAERVAGMWHGGPWPGSVWEARAELRLAQGHHDQAAALFREAAEMFAGAGHAVARERCAIRAAVSVHPARRA